MYLQSGLGRGTSGGRRPCAVPASVTLRKLVLNDTNRAAIGAALGLGRAATTSEVKTILTDAAQRAVELIGRAAWPLRRPRATGAAGEPMRLRFRDAFGAMPEFVPAWRPAGERWDGGAVVRERLRCAAKILAEGDIEFVVWGPGSCPFSVQWTPDTWAWVQEGRYRICLGAAFWNSKASLDERATTLVHECLHIYFSTIVDEEGRGPYNRAACYERYVLISNKLPISDYVTRVCPSNAPVGDFPVPVRRGTEVAGLGTSGFEFDVHHALGQAFVECPDLFILKSVLRKLATAANDSARGQWTRHLVTAIRLLIEELPEALARSCCEPGLRQLEKDIDALSWPLNTQLYKQRLIDAVRRAQASAKLDYKHC